MFDDIPGQERAKRYFAASLAKGAAHAYLLAGDEGLGKKAFALELAAALVSACGGCGACDDCARARRGAHPDLAVIEREGEFIRKEQMARVIADLSLKPFAAGRRVWVIVEPEKFKIEAANSFLKSLEEPPAHAHFILVSGAVGRVLPTIVSRCQVVEFRPVADKVLAAHLTSQEGLQPADAEVIARLARGSVGRAHRLIADDRGPQRRQRYLKLAAAVVFHDRDAERSFVEEVATAEEAAAAEVAVDAARRRDDLERAVADKAERAWRLKVLEARAKRETLRVSRLACLDALDHLGSWLRDVWVVGLGGDTAVCNRDYHEQLQHGSVARPELYARLLDVVGATRKDVFYNVDRALALRAMFARFQEVWEGA